MNLTESHGIHPLIFILGLAVAGGVGAFVGTAAEDSRISMPAGSSLSSLDEERLLTIERRLGRLEEETSVSPVEVGSQPQRVAVSGETVDVNTLTVLDQRIARLEAAEDERKRTIEEKRQEREISRQEQIAQAQQTILNPRVKDKDKLIAWSRLRYSAELWSDALVQEMVRIGSTSDDPALRANVWRQADGNGTHPFLLRPLINSLLSDQDPQVRAEAAETLEIYRDQAGVKAALDQASRMDQDEGVRKHARHSLQAR